MRNIIVCTIVFLFALSSCRSNDGEIKITGKIKGYPDSTKVVLMNWDTNKGVDTTYIVNNKFHCIVSNTKATPHGIFIGDGRSAEYLFLFLEDVDISIKGSKEYIKYANVDGGELEKQKGDYMKSCLPLETRYDSMGKEMMKAVEAKDMVKAKSISEQRNKIIHERTANGVLYIKENPDNLYSAFILKGKGAMIPKSEVKSLYENLSPKVKDSDFAKSTLKWLELNKEVKVGDIAENFQLTDLNGNKASLKDFQGKYVLLEFWKSGCPGCRKENKNLLKEYETYKEKEFEIISISSDKNKDHWKRANNKDSMTWVSLHDTNIKDGNVGIRYGVTLIPSNFLIDPRGRIIAKDLKGSKLGEKLKKIFGA